MVEANTKGPAKRGKSAAKRTTTDEGPIEVQWSLAELPTTQHRAGLAGLVLFVEWLESIADPKRNEGICTIVSSSESGATMRVDRNGMRRLYDRLYAASAEEVERPQPLKNKAKAVIPPIRTVEREVADAKGKSKPKTFYVYPQTIPHGGPLLEWDPARNGENGPWVKLWRDLTWSVLRGIPAQRLPYEQRADKLPSTDWEHAWKQLTGDPDETVDLASTDFLGAQAFNAEYVSFKDRARWQFLLQFWSFAIGIYVPVIVDPREGKREFHGFALAIPDVSLLRSYCDAFPSQMRMRGVKMNGYRPTDAVVDVSGESALDQFMRLEVALKSRTGRDETGSAVLGYDVLHVGKEGNNVRLYNARRIEPDMFAASEHNRLRSNYRDAFFRKQRIENLLRGLPPERWFDGFDRLAAVLPWETQLIGSTWFRHDAHVAFEEVRERMKSADEDNDGIERLVKRVVDGYLVRKVKVRTSIEWRPGGKLAPHDGHKVNEARDKAVKDAFLAVRARPNSADFREYFAGTLCAMPHAFSVKQYELLADALRNRTEDVRTLTMLALAASARWFEPNKTES
jgi:CRISPR-associated protein Cmx8